MWGMVAIETTKQDGPKLCSNINHPSGFSVYPNKREAIEAAADLSVWYQAEIRIDVVFAPVPLPLY